MGECHLSRREVNQYRWAFFWPRECLFDSHSTAEELRPEDLDGYKDLSPLEQLSFQASWARFSSNWGSLYYADLTSIRRDLTNSFRRLQTPSEKIQYVEVAFDWSGISDDWALTADQSDSMKRGIVTLIQEAYQLGEDPPDRLRILADGIPMSIPHTTITITDRNMKELLLDNEGYRLRAMLDYMFPQNPPERQEVLEFLRNKYQMPTATREEILSRDLQERSDAFFSFLALYEPPAAGYTFWTGLDHYFSVDGGEFGNPTPDEDCLILLKEFFTDVPGGQCGDMSAAYLEGLMVAIANVAIHELGHAFGLPHQHPRDVETSIMSTDGCLEYRAAPFKNAEQTYLQAIFRN